MADAGAMAGSIALQVGRCTCETARDRYRVSENVRIDFEHMAPFPFLADDDEEDISESSEDEDDSEVDVEFNLTSGAPPSSSLLQTESGNEDGPGTGDEVISEGGDLEGDYIEEDISEGASDVGEIPVTHVAQQTSPTIGSDEEEEEEEEEEDDNNDEGMVFLDDDTDDLDSTTGGTDSAEHNPFESDVGVPKIARWRLNLTALSQKYNLYFVAYRDRIHVSRPRSCSTHNLPSIPDLVLKPNASVAAQSVGGTLDPELPHQVNHLIIGDFGEEELLLMAYDDGDVIAYFTRGIEDEVIRRQRYIHEKSAFSKARPFLHENVGISAWGLAIHAKSRVIAVGSNAHSVTVFLPALTGHPLQTALGDRERLYHKIRKNTSGHVMDCNIKMGENPLENERWIRRRDINWMIILDTRPLGDNIPNIAFGSDKSGNADKVVAIDVKGSLWLLNIWEFNVACSNIPALHRSPPNIFPGDIGRPRGWGVIVIHESSFLPTRDYKDSLGLPPDEIRYVNHSKIGQWVDVSQSIKYIPHNSTQHPWARVGTRGRDGVRFAAQEHDRLVRNEWWGHSYLLMPPEAHDLASRRSLSGRQHHSLVSSASYRHERQLILGDGASILRLYETDMELRPHDKRGTGVMMQHVTKQIQIRPQGLPALRWAHERLSNNHYIPELSLVIAGSMCGRVALVTLTRPEHDAPFARGFKVEAILPTKQDEDERLRPICPLFGVAVGPLPTDGRPDAYSSTPRRPRRYRIMLQYYDQRILSYEISRGPEFNILTIV